MQQGTQECTEHADRAQQPAQLRIMYIMSNRKKSLGRLGTWLASLGVRLFRMDATHAIPLGI